MNQLETAKKITAYLDKGTAQLKAGTAYKLQLARQAAVATAGGQPQRSSELALAGGRSGSLGGRPLLGDARLRVGVLLLAGSVLLFRSWQIGQPTRCVQ